MTTRDCEMDVAADSHPGKALSALLIGAALFLPSCGDGDKNVPSATSGPAAGAAARGPGAANAGRGPGVEAKILGALPSRPGTRPARLEVTPNGRVLITCLTADRKTPEALDAKSLKIVITAHDEVERLLLEPHPNGEAETKAGTASSYTVMSKLLARPLQKGAQVTVNYGGDPEVRAVFDLPAGYRSY
jgi:hypothetical protein